MIAALILAALPPLLLLARIGAHLATDDLGPLVCVACGRVPLRPRDGCACCAGRVLA